MLAVLEGLRRRFFLAKGALYYRTCAAEMGINKQTLTRYAKGGSVSMETLAIIEQWVLAKEATYPELRTEGYTVRQKETR